MGSFSSTPVVKRAVLQPFNQVLNAKTVPEVVVSTNPEAVLLAFIVHQKLFVVTSHAVTSYELKRGEAQPEKFAVPHGNSIVEAVRPSLHFLALCFKSGEITLLAVPMLNVVMQFDAAQEGEITGAGAPPMQYQRVVTSRQDSQVPVSAFGLFTKAKKESITQAQPHLEEVEVLKRIAMEWDALPEDHRSRFKAEAAGQRKAYDAAVFYVGYSSGVVLQFNSNTRNSTFTHTPVREDAGSAVAFTYSIRWNLMFVGSTGSQSAIFIYSPHVSHSIRELTGIAGRVMDLAIFDSRNQVIGLSSINSMICVWDFMTSYLLLEIPYPTLLEGVFPTRLKLLVKEGAQLMLIGLSEGSLTLNSYIYDADNSDYRIVPYKIVTSQNSEVVASIEYDAELDMTLVGDCRSTVILYNHLEAASVEDPEEQRLVSRAVASDRPVPESSSKASLFSRFFGSSSPVPQPEQELAEVPAKPASSSVVEQAPRQVNPEYLAKTRERVEGKRKAEAKPLNPFEQFLNEKKPVVEAENPGILRKDMILRVSAMWAELDEETRSQYESS